MNFKTSLSQDKIISYTPLSGSAGDGTIPEKPELESVSIDTSTGHIIIEWIPSPSPDVEYYRIYKRFRIGDEFAGELIDSVSADNHRFEHDNPEALKNSVAYSVAAVDSAKNKSEISDYHATMFTTIKYDSCNQKMFISSTPYIGWKDSLSKYEIYLKNTDGTCLLIDESPDTSGGTHSGILENTDYCYFVKALRTDGKESFSNTVCKFTYMPSQPSYINADFATVTPDNLISLSFTYDPAAESKDFILLRARGLDNPPIVWKRFSGVNSNPLTYIDTLVTITDNFTYQLVSINSCNTRKTCSNEAGNIVFNATHENMDVTISWTEYKNWWAGVDQYYLYRIINETDVEILDSLDPGETTYTDDLKPLVNMQISGHICYLVEAREKDGNVYGVKGSSRSNMSCITITPEVYMPNAFTPNNDGKNDEIGPIVTFIPEDYLFVIYDRWGRKMFESADPDEKWDGTINSVKANAGVYVYFLKVITTENFTIEKRGHITLLYP